LTSFKIKLDMYEGPMDLLLYLVRKDELDVQDIPISRIANEYLAYVNLLKLLDIEFAADFVLMAATLMRIKVRSLLPTSPEEEEEEDPRFELQQRLAEYQRYKEAAARLGRIEESARDHFPRACAPVLEDAPEEETLVGLFDLLTAFKTILERRKEIDVYEVQAPRRSVEERMEEILAGLVEKTSVKFESLFTGYSTKLDLIVTFLAILELMKEGRIAVSQRRAFGAITIRLARTAEKSETAS
jgi:segregation and condensation protein A